MVKNGADAPDVQPTTFCLFVAQVKPASQVNGRADWQIYQFSWSSFAYVVAIVDLQEDSENHPQVSSFSQVSVFCLPLIPLRPILNKSSGTLCPGGSVGRGVHPVATTSAFPDPVSLAGMPRPRSRPWLHVALAKQLEAANTTIDRRIFLLF